MTEFENLSFNLTLSGTYWDKIPVCSVWLDEEKIETRSIEGSQQIIFSRQLEPGPHTLKIRLENKSDSDTIKENQEIVKDMLLNIDDITIDDISLGNLIWQADYILDRPHEYHGKIINNLSHCVNLGWNGTYELKFYSPFYIWLLENL
jgi:hypothetical protein